MSQPITVAIERRIDPALHDYARTWLQQGIDLASTRPGFLGAGWVEEAAGSDTWHMLYRFDDAALLAEWEGSEERRRWLDAGAAFAHEARVERRTGIEGWFDAVEGITLPGEHVQIRVEEPAPPRWKQAVTVWTAFFPMNLLATFLLGLIPGFEGLQLWLRLLISTLLLTPVMVVVVLPFVTRLFRPWLRRGLAAPGAHRDSQHPDA
ncbi:antibiotic biosynthesis monooxygenase [Agrococcus sp. SL85]|uniref:antibiotic biosynthesis monooxygenase n=1 Tax=Agrococcus sp. SL85 TaxID=2995141 RepID=UPI00226C8AA8|nr:antibiotic biosynthesis monooxygenase [Agrococcus sp. SL85]WAC66800.1 antibiotic biosynthesis monooxygenase [Agrococcus sp. SL85]